MAATLMLALPLAGCTTTMHAAQRERLESARQRAALEPTRVTRANPLVPATEPAVIRAGAMTALVLTVRNHSRHAVSDLPISVGYTTVHGADVYLNARAGLSYFSSHLPAIGAGSELTWVFTTRRRLPAGAHTFAYVGRRSAAPALLTEAGVRLALRYRPTAGGHSVTIEVRNTSGVPQYELQLYAYARREGRYVAAGNATVADLGPGASERVRLALVGTSTDQPHVGAIPTILQ